jgi:hypothetical protein
MHAPLSDNFRPGPSRAAAQPPVRRQPIPLPSREATPLDEPHELEEPSDLDDFGMPQIDDACWDVFLPDDDEYDPLPEPDDFAGSLEHRIGRLEPD